MRGAHCFSIALLCVILSRVKSMCFLVEDLRSTLGNRVFFHWIFKRVWQKISSLFSISFISYMTRGLKCKLKMLFDQPIASSLHGLLSMIIKWRSGDGQSCSLSSYFEGEVGAGWSQRSWGCCRWSRRDQFAVRHRTGLIYCSSSCKVLPHSACEGNCQKKNGQVNLHIKPLMIELKTSYC